MKRKMTIFLAFLLSLEAAAGPYLSPLTSADSGLSNDNITALCHDSRSFVWIGTASACPIVRRQSCPWIYSVLGRLS